VKPNDHTYRKASGGRNPALVVIVLAALLLSCCSDGQKSRELFVTEIRSSDSIPRFEILELTFKHNGSYDNKFLDVSVDAVFTSPRGVSRRVKGFFYGGDLWKVRFRPSEPGEWTYSYTITGKSGFSKRGTGVFLCTPSDAEGPVVHNPENPHRWIFANGRPYFPLGLQDCVGVNEGKLSTAAVDGGTRKEGGRVVSWEEYFSLYGQAGFNLLRFSQRNCSYSLFDDLDHYREAESIATDELLSMARKHGFRVLFGFFGNYRTGLFENKYLRFLVRAIQKALGKGEVVSTPAGSATAAKEKRFIDYCIARWGVYADFWELLNEREASDEWTTLMADYVHSADPDLRPVSTSWEKPNLQSIDINAPHWYESESELESDLRVQERAVKWKQAGKPVLVGEQGNSGMNWDPLSAARMRIRAWTALFEEIGLIFWNTSWSKAGVHLGRYTPGGASNIYLGPEEREYIRVLQDFSSRLDAGVRRTPISVSSAVPIRAYGLTSNVNAAAYLHHVGDHTSVVRDAKITLELPNTARLGLIGQWIDPSKGSVLASVKISPGSHTVQVPPFNVDLALLVSAKGP